MECTFENWKKFRRWNDERVLIDNAISDTNHPFHKMVTAEKMSRKRLRKLLMATCPDKQRIDEYLDKMHKKGVTYLRAWRHNMRSIVYQLDTVRKYRLLKELFPEEAVAALDGHHDEAKLAAYTKSLEEGWNTDKAIIESYPDIKTSDDASAALRKYFAESLKNRVERKVVIDELERLTLCKFWYYWSEQAA